MEVTHFIIEKNVISYHLLIDLTVFQVHKKKQVVFVEFCGIGHIQLLNSTHFSTQSTETIFTPAFCAFLHVVECPSLKTTCVTRLLKVFETCRIKQRSHLWVWKSENINETRRSGLFLLHETLAQELILNSMSRIALIFYVFAKSSKQLKPRSDYSSQCKTRWRATVAFYFHNFFSLC